MSAETLGYTYKNGAYYRNSDGTGPYVYNGASLSLLTWSPGVTQVGLSGTQFKDRGYHRLTDAAGPMSVS
jgi:hypothetical protein